VAGGCHDAPALTRMLFAKRCIPRFGDAAQPGPQPLASCMRARCRAVKVLTHAVTVACVRIDLVDAERRRVACSYDEQETALVVKRPCVLESVASQAAISNRSAMQRATMLLVTARNMGWKGVLCCMAEGNPLAISEHASS
jgi:hypothetical protein